ncbi:hypothetical protein [Nostoc sp. LPT]|uniref:hypothetical protein n=1 Tax=Nostoc sp. LPT TaxID=2815387 RepID=UPI001D44031F|nr:hypothetical protein [Nostoc sp. LPT]MBN4000326.1 hypothetical protein [Nostoc sp. LPT]
MWVYGGCSHLWIILSCDRLSFTQNLLISLHKFIQHNSSVDNNGIVSRYNRIVSRYNRIVSRYNRIADR